MKLGFTNEMKFPSDLASLINESGVHSKLLEVLMLNGDTKEIEKNLKSWKVTSVSETEIVISLIFDKPILVS